MKIRGRITWVIVALGLLGFGLFTFVSNRPSEAKNPLKGQRSTAKYFCPMHPNYTSEKPGDCPICNMRLVPIETSADHGKHAKTSSKKEVLFYRHPMRPEVTSPVPAKDEMGMDYTPVYETEGPEQQDPKEVCLMHDCPMVHEGQKCPMLVVAVKGEKLNCPVCKEQIDTGMDQTLNISTAPAGYAPVLISPEKQRLIGIRTGLVEKKPTEKVVRAVGRIAYDPELYQGQAEYIQSVKSLRNAQKSSDAEAVDWATKLAESARTKLIRMGLNSQMIEALENQSGPDKSLLYAVPDGETWVYANIYEYEIPLVKVGDDLDIEMPSESGRKISGRIRSIDTVVDPATRTVRVRALVKNEGGIFKPDMYVNTSLRVGLGDILTVPEEAVFSTGEANIVFVDKGGGLLEPRDLVLGQHGDDFFEVKEGLREGERVVVNGNFLVDSESRLKSALSSMSGHSHGS